MNINLEYIMVLNIYGLKYDFIFSDDWQKLDTMPEDPFGACVIGKQNENSQCMVLIYPIEENSVMPFNKPQNVINGIHNSLADDQGLIEVQTMEKNVPIIYSIIKTKLNPSGIQYFLRLHFKINNNYYSVDGFFSEIGITGARETNVYDLSRREGIIKEGMQGWTFDPYDKNYKKGLLMNISEDRKYDKLFPTHPISEARDFVNVLNENIIKYNK
jgi:hypothetical protein